MFFFNGKSFQFMRNDMKKSYFPILYSTLVTCIISFNIQFPVGKTQTGIIISIGQIRNLKFKDVNCLVQGHIIYKL